MARKDVHSLVSGMGGACSIVETIVREARDCSVSDEAIHSLTTEKGRKIIRSWVQSLKEVPTSVLTLHDLILAGHYDWWHKDILKWKREDQPLDELGKVELLDLGRDISTEDALVEIGHRGYGPANIEELCGYGAKHPDAQRKNPIVALKSVFVHPTNGYRCSPYLSGNGTKRRLHLHYRGSDWLGRCRFLVVRNSPHSRPNYLVGV